MNDSISPCDDFYAFVCEKNVRKDELFGSEKLNDTNDWSLQGDSVHYHIEGSIPLGKRKICTSS